MRIHFVKLMGVVMFISVCSGTSISTALPSNTPFNTAIPSNHAINTFITCVTNPLSLGTSTSSTRNSPILQAARNSMPNYKRFMSACLNYVGTGCYYLNWRKCGDLAYCLQNKLATEAPPVKNAYLLRQLILDTLNAFEAACHYKAGVNAMNNDEISQNAASSFHRLGNKAHDLYANVAHYEGFLKDILDKTDLTKKSHLLATALVSVLALHLSFKIYYHCIYRPLAYTGDTLILQPTKNLGKKALAFMKGKIASRTHNHEPIPTPEYLAPSFLKQQ